MDELTSSIENFQLEIKKIEDFVSLYLRKEKIANKIKTLNDRAKNVKLLVEQCHQMMKKDELKNVADKHKKLLSKINAQQLKVLNVMELIKNQNDKCKPSYVTSKRDVLLMMTPTPKFRKPIENSVTPRMYLSDYEQSPYVVKKRPVSLQFLDFETTLTDEMFETIPKYLRGRETASDLRTFLDETIIPCFNDKYQLLYRKRETLINQKDIELWKSYRDQALYFPGMKFITQGDISRKLDRMVDKKTLSRIGMLRHLGIIREERKNSVTCYIWTFKT